MTDQRLPTGLVTFLLTDVVSSTARWRADGAAAVSDMERLGGIIAGRVSEAGGVQPLVQGEGDSSVAVFVDPFDALEAAHRMQVEIGQESWAGGPLDIRIGVHTGRASLVDDHTYGGRAIIRAARLRDLAYGRQVVVSNATAAMVDDDLDVAYGLSPLGEVTLKGWDRPEQIHQLTHPDLPAAFPSPIRLSVAPTTPTYPTRLVGRDREVDELESLIAANPVVTITGAGGCGKTRLAAAVADRVQPDFGAGVVWIDLARVAETGEVAAVAVGACGMSPTANDDPVEMLRHHVHGQAVLLVFDNCEHLLSATAALVEGITALDSEGRILLTSREALGMPGETTWRTPSLGFPAADDPGVGALVGSGAVALFVDRASEADSSFELNDTNARSVAKICRRLDGMPLALELAAARLRTMPVDELADRLDERFRLLTAGSRTALERQRTLLASVEWSHDLLDPREQVVFRRLSVFSSPFTVEAAEAVVADDDLRGIDVLDLLTSLVEKNLVQPTPRGRYRLLETMRAFGLERLLASGETSHLRDRHVVWALGCVEAWHLDEVPATHPVVAEIGEVAPDLITALRWAAHNDPSNVEPLVSALRVMWMARWDFAELEAVMMPVLDELGVGTVEWLTVLANVAIVLLMNGNADWLEPAVEARLAHDEILSDRARVLIDALGSWMQLWDAHPDGPDGIRQVINRCVDVGLHSYAADAAPFLAMQLAAIGHSADARRELSETRDRFVPGATGDLLVDMAEALIADAQGDFTTAREITLPYLDAEDPPEVISSLASYLALHADDEDLAVRSRRAITGTGQPGIALHFSAFARAAEQVVGGDPSAGASLDAAAGQSSTAGDVATVLRFSAAHRLASGELVEARDRLDKLREILEGRDIPAIHAQADVCEAWLVWIQGDEERAVDWAHRALARADEAGTSLACIDALEVLGCGMAATDPDTAGRLVGITLEFHARTGYRRERHVAAELEKVGDLLPADALAVGRDLKIDEGVALVRGNRGPRERPGFGWDSLTPAESRVVDLVAEGLTNQDIADKLFVSVATVKTHLVHSYRKLEIGSRTELAAAVSARQQREADSGSGSVGCPG